MNIRTKDFKKFLKKVCIHFNSCPTLGVFFFFNEITSVSNEYVIRTRYDLNFLLLSEKI